MQVDFELRGCPINKVQLLEVISAFLGRPEPEHPDGERLPRVQAPGERLRARRPRHAVPRTRHPGRLRRDLPGVRPRLLRMLRPAGHRRTRHRSRGPSSTSSAWTRPTRCSGSTARSTPTSPGVPGSRRRRALGGEGPVTERTIARRLPRAGSRGRGRSTSGSTGPEVEEVELRDLRAAAVLRGVPPGPRGTSEAPDITARICGICPVAYQMSSVPRPGARPGPPGRRHPRSVPCGGSCTAGSGSRATRSTSTCCTRPTSSGIRTRSGLAKDHPEAVQRGLTLEEGRQRADAARWAAARSTRSMSESGGSTVSRRGRSPGTARAARGGARPRGRDRSLRRGLLVPRRRGARTSSSPSGTRRSIR